MEIFAKMLLGSALGAAFGFMLGRARCSSEACNIRANMVLSILAGAFFGAAIGWYFATR